MRVYSDCMSVNSKKFSAQLDSPKQGLGRTPTPISNHSTPFLLQHAEILIVNSLTGAKGSFIQSLFLWGVVVLI